MVFSLSIINDVSVRNAQKFTLARFYVPLEFQKEIPHSATRDDYKNFVLRNNFQNAERIITYGRTRKNAHHKSWP